MVGPLGPQKAVAHTRLLEMLSDRFGAFEAIAKFSIKLARVAPEEELAMEPLVAEALLEFAEDLRGASRVASARADGHAGAKRHRTAGEVA